MTQSEQSSLTSAVKYVRAIFRWHTWKKRDCCVCLYTFPQLTERKTLPLVRDSLVKAIRNTQSYFSIQSPNNHIVNTSSATPRVPKTQPTKPPRRIFNHSQPWVALQISLITFSLPSQNPNLQCPSTNKPPAAWRTAAPPPFLSSHPS